MPRLFDEYDPEHPDPANVWHGELPLPAPPEEIIDPILAAIHVPDELDESGYVPGWKAIAARKRSDRMYTCERCRVDLSQRLFLLHVHHLDRDRTNNDMNNLQALCALCHAECEGHEHLIREISLANAAYIRARRRGHKLW